MNRHLANFIVHTDLMPVAEDERSLRIFAVFVDVSGYLAYIALLVFHVKDFLRQGC